MHWLSGRAWQRLDPFDDPAAAHDQLGAGLDRNFTRTLRRSLQGWPRAAQIGAFGLIDGFGVHRSLQSKSTGVSPALLYKAQVSTVGA